MDDLVGWYVAYFGYLLGAVGSSFWVYRDAKRRGLAHARALTMALAILFPVGLLGYVLSR